MILIKASTFVTVVIIETDLAGALQYGAANEFVFVRFALHC